MSTVPYSPQVRRKGSHQIDSDLVITRGTRWFTASRMVLLGALMAAPLAFGAVEAWAWGGMFALVGTALLLWCAGCVAAKRMRITFSVVYVPMVGGLALTVCQLASGRTLDPIGTREALIKFAMYAVIFFATVQLSANLHENGWARLGRVVTIYLFAIAVFAILQYFTSAGEIYWTVRPKWGGTIFGPYVNRNHYAGLLEILIPLGIAGVLGLWSGHSFKPFAVFAVFIGIASVLLCGSRGGTIALTVEMGLFLFAAIAAWRRSEAINRKRSVLAAAITGLTLIVLASFTWLDDGTVLNRWASLAESPEIASEARRQIAADTFLMWRDSVVAGVGAGAFEVSYPSWQRWATDSVVDHAHNDYLELLNETGVTGGLLALIAIVMVLRRGFALVWRTGNPESAQGWTIGKWMRVGATIACCGLLVHSFTDFNLHIPANAAWFAMAVGIADGRS